MDSTVSTPLSHPPEPRNRTKSSSRRSKFRRVDVAAEISPSVPNQESLSENLEMGDNCAEPVVAVRRGRRSKNISSVCASPRNARRPRKRLDQEMVRDEKDSEVGDEVIIKPRKKRQIARLKKDKIALVPSVPSPREEEGVNLDRYGKLISDVLMWRDVAKSSLWFGFGSLCFLSSCFASGINFSIFSAMSQMGLLFLAVSFILNTLRPREIVETRTEMKLKEDDILRMGKFILPAVNLAISKTGDVFSGEPAMTLKVVPFLMVGAEYGHLLTLWRLCALGFFVSFTAPRFYSSYSTQIRRKGECIRCWVMEAWCACSHKKIIALSVFSAFWNLTTARTRIFAAFICLAMIRYYTIHSGEKVKEVVEQEAQEHENQ